MWRKKIILIQALILSIISSSNIFGQERIQSIYLLGDAGSSQAEVQGILDLLKSQIEATENNTILFLGDNIFPSGLQDSTENRRIEAEVILKNIITKAAHLNAQTYLIPGEKDWDNGGREGWGNVKNQDAYIDSQKFENITFLPDGGCPGPIEIPINKEIVLVIIDTQWILHPWDKPKIESDCSSKSTIDIIVHLQDIINRNKHKKLVIASHHPVFSFGLHGTKAFGGIQDLTNYKYKAMSREFSRILNLHGNAMHVSAHDNSLQYIKRENSHYIVSGSAAITQKVKTGPGARFSSDSKGFAKLDFFKNGAVNLSFWSSDKKLFEETILDFPFLTEEENLSDFTIDEGQKMTGVADETISLNARKYWFLGENYREAWNVPLEVRVFDIGKEKGGLRILQKGGGFQTRSLRLENPEGKQYVLRSIKKYPERAIPEALKETFAVDLIKDLVSSSHPYGAFAISGMAEAAGIYHTNPELVFVPDDPRLGEYREDYANMLFLFEERPAGDREDIDSFGNSKKLYSTSKMLDKLYGDNDNYVDQQWVLKSRVFDNLVGDWDRHDDQWRWASFKKGKGRMFRPIPRDRDQAFFTNQGLLMSMLKKKWAVPKFQGFGADIKNTPGAVYNARHFDRDFLNGLSREDWINAAQEIQHKVTDEIIEKSIQQWPEPVYNLNGERITEQLKARRENIEKIALSHYNFLAKEVTIHGSNKKEYFKVERLDDGNTRIRVYKNTNDNKEEKLLYDRTFKSDETKEVRMFGLKGKDEFEITGNVNKGLRLRVIGGKGHDIITDRSRVRGIGKRTKVYDTKDGNTISLSKEARDKTSNDPLVNIYNRNEFKYDNLTPLVTAKINADEGFYLGGGFIYTEQGFRKSPYKSKHQFIGSIALETRSYEFKYQGEFIESLGRYDLLLEAKALAPTYISNFFGFGNASIFDEAINQSKNVDESIDYYRTLYKQFAVEALVRRKIGEKATISFGQHFQAFEAENEYDGEDRFILDNSAIVSDIDIFRWRSYEGGVLKFQYDTRDKKGLVNRGIFLNLDLRGYTPINTYARDFGKFEGDFSYYTPLKANRIVFAIRLGGGHSFGDYEFYQAQILDGQKELRGYRKTRFFGDSKLFNNTELRIRLFSFKNRVAPASVGLTIFNDVGRVWFKGENSNKWHHGFGGGVWIAPLNAVAIGVDVGHSEEETLGYFRVGFLF